jgi:hypothetical protein
VRKAVVEQDLVCRHAIIFVRDTLSGRTATFDKPPEVRALGSRVRWPRRGRGLVAGGPGPSPRLPSQDATRNTHEGPRNAKKLVTRTRIWRGRQADPRSDNHHQRNDQQTEAHPIEPPPRVPRSAIHPPTKACRVTHVNGVGRGPCIR